MNLQDIERRLLPLSILLVLKHTLTSMIRKRFKSSAVVDYLYEFGNKSLGIVILCVSFVGVIIFVEYSYHMKLIIANDSMIPAFAMIMLTRELAPAIAAMLLASKMGASIAAELGAMKTTEQLDAYRLLGLNPIDLFVTPRFIASALATLALTFLSLLIAVLGGWVVCVVDLQFTTGSFFQSLFSFTRPADFILMSVKAVIFGASIPVIASTLGFRCQFGAEGVGMATTNAVVSISIWVIVSNFFLTFIYSMLI